MNNQETIKQKRSLHPYPTSEEYGITLTKAVSSERPVEQNVHTDLQWNNTEAGTESDFQSSAPENIHGALEGYEIIICIGIIILCLFLIFIF